MARRRFFVDRIEDNCATLHGEDAHHLARVLRAEPGQRYEITDGASLYLAEIASAAPREVVFHVVATLDAGAPLPPIVILASLIKFDRFEWMIEKVTELGVKAVIPVEAARTDAGLLKAAVKRVERWRKIAREASQQSRRISVPRIHDALSLDAALGLTFGLKIRLEENPGAPLLIECLRGWDGAVELGVAIGPEGGWTEAERVAMNHQGWLPVSLGNTILRAETAAIAAAAIIGTSHPTSLPGNAG